MKSRLFSASILFLAFVSVLPSQVFAIPRCGKCPYSCGDLGLGRKDCSDTSSSQGVCCVDLSNKGMEIAQERDRVLAANPTPSQERCPSGFQPSERKCTTEERRRGCKDMRLPGGLGCVHR